MKRILLATLLASSASLLGCRPDNPYKASTWTKQLDDSKSLERATQWLEQLGDPSAIPELGKAWEKQAHPVRILQVMISLARPLTPQQAEAAFMTDFATTGRKASWDQIMPFLKKAVQEVDDTNQRSVDSAAKAADAIGESGLEDGLDVLIEYSQRPTSKKLIASQLGAIRSIGKFGQSNRSKAIAALTKIVERDPAPHPKTAKDADQRRAMSEAFEQYLMITSTAVNALGELRTPEATQVLLVAMYRSPELFTQVRRAIIGTGAGVEPELRKIIRGEHTEVNAFITSKRLDKWCGDRGELPPDQCVALAGRDYYATVVLGDLYSPASIPDLLNVLKQPAAPAHMFGGSPGPVQHNAVFDALRKIGSADAAEPLKAIWKDSKAELSDRAFAVSAYAFASRDGNTGDLAALIKDSTVPSQVRIEAATTIGRLATSMDAAGALDPQIEEYQKKVDEFRKQADTGIKGEYEKAKAKFDAANATLVAAKKAASAAAKDKASSMESLQKVKADVDAAQQVFNAAKGEERLAYGKFNPIDVQIKQYTSAIHGVQANLARIEIAKRCGQTLSCYADALKEPKDGSAVVGRMGAYIKDIATWTNDEKKLLHAVQIERAMMELGKRGQAAGEFTDVLLDNAVADDRLIRESIMLALPKLAKVPCDKCEAKLAAAIKAGQGKSTLAQLNVETQMLANYFSWAGGKTPAKTAEAPPK